MCEVFSAFFSHCFYGSLVCTVCTVTQKVIFLYHGNIILIILTIMNIISLNQQWPVFQGKQSGFSLLDRDAAVLKRI